MKQSDSKVLGTYAAVLLEDQWAVCWLKGPPQMTEERVISMAPQCWGVECLLEWNGVRAI